MLSHCMVVAWHHHLVACGRKLCRGIFVHSSLGRSLPCTLWQKKPRTRQTERAFQKTFWALRQIDTCWSYWTPCKTCENYTDCNLKITQLHQLPATAPGFQIGSKTLQGSNLAEHMEKKWEEGIWRLSKAPKLGASKGVVLDVPWRACAWSCMELWPGTDSVRLWAFVVLDSFMLLDRGRDIQSNTSWILNVIYGYDGTPTSLD